MLQEVFQLFHSIHKTLKKVTAATSAPAHRLPLVQSVKTTGFKLDT